jgi:hypothetical protein
LRFPGTEKRLCEGWLFINRGASLKHVPKTISDWEALTSEMSGRELYQQAIVANSMPYITSLIQEGYSNESVKEIFGVIAKSLLEKGVTPPQEGPYDYEELCRQFTARVDRL